MGEGDGVRVDVVLPLGEVFLLRDDLTLPGVGEGEGVRVDVVLPLGEVFLLRDDLPCLGWVKERE